MILGYVSDFKLNLLLYSENWFGIYKKLAYLY